MPLTASIQAAKSAEYNIYIYDKPNDRAQHSTETWRLYGTTADMIDALRKAKTLHDTSLYQRVEVKKKFYDSKRKRVMDATLKSFQHHSKRMFKLYAALTLCVFASCVGIAIAF